MQQWDKIQATFRPVRTDTLASSAKAWIGWTGEWTVQWIIEDGPYTGQWSLNNWYPTVGIDTRLPMGWVPESDLELAGTQCPRRSTSGESG